MMLLLLKKHEMKDNITFSYYNLVCCGLFGKMNVIFSENVINCFHKHFNNHIFNLFGNNLCPEGFRCLDPRKMLAVSVIKKDFDICTNPNKIHRRNR